ncbi:hypothetical protein [Polyangium mundeleinium]|uniref:PE-PGRS family protein n=1 Tax=Polyangium mundeleinium TaxID=2995306 RepID=A0ABT5ENA9_9BACT|nr:hypothetical protein [Polyangium mundeleinium]MDC0743327.1 hypothetical protein [Polyangium mundeleinium]
MRRRPILAALSVLVAAAFAGCLEPTQITLEIVTDLDCSRIDSTAIVVSNEAQAADTIRDPGAVASECNGGRIGALVLLPKSAKNESIAIKVVTGVGLTAEDCLNDPAQMPAPGRGCIVARRRLSFIPSTPLELPVRMRGDCIGEVCDPESTCVAKGLCVDSLVNEQACKGEDTEETCQPTGGAGPGGSGGMGPGSGGSGGGSGGNGGGVGGNGGGVGGNGGGVGGNGGGSGGNGGGSGGNGGGGSGGSAGSGGMGPGSGGSGAGGSGGSAGSGGMGPGSGGSGAGGSGGSAGSGGMGPGSGGSGAGGSGGSAGSGGMGPGSGGSGAGGSGGSAGSGGMGPGSGGSGGGGTGGSAGSGGMGPGSGGSGGTGGAGTGGNDCPPGTGGAGGQGGIPVPMPTCTGTVTKDNGARPPPKPQTATLHRVRLFTLDALPRTLHP